VNRYFFGIQVVWALVVTVCGAAPAAAQGTGVPFAGLLGRAAKGQQSLDVRGGVFGTYDDNVLAQGVNSGDFIGFDPRAQTAGVASGFDGSISYGYGRAGRGKSQSVFQFGSSASIKEFSTGLNVGNLWVPSAGASLSLGTNLTPKISMNLRGDARYAPYYQYAPFLRNTAPLPGDVPLNLGSTADPTTSGDTTTAAEPLVVPSVVPPVSPAGADSSLAISSLSVASLNVGATITDRFTKRDSLILDMNLEETQIFGVARVDNRLVRGTYSHSLTRKLSLHGGYGIQENQYTSSSLTTPRTSSQLIDFGADYHDGFTFARYYTLNFTTGMTGVRQADQTALRFAGAVSLGRSIGRSWSASIGAQRGTEYVVGISQPLFTDSANAGVGGQIGPRVQVSAGAGYMQAQRAFVNSSDRLISKNASTRMTVAMTQHIAFFANYSVSMYTVPVGYFVDLDFPRNFNRRSATVGLQFWLPLINRQARRQ
jgi:hypothetical protein